MYEDRTVRDAALELVKADIAHVRQDISAQGVGSRLADRFSEGAVDVFEEAVEVADDNRGVFATLVAAVFIWFARNPIMSLFDDTEENGGDEEFHDLEPERDET